VGAKEEIEGMRRAQMTERDAEGYDEEKGPNDD